MRVAARGAAMLTPAQRVRMLAPLAALILLVPGARASGVFYVSSSSASCSDAGAGTQTQPYCTITAALAAHHDAGTTINVMPGVYREQVTVPGSGASGSPVVLQGLGSSSQPVVVDGTDDFSDPALWAQYSGDVWLASSVTWAPIQVFADDARLTPSTASPATLPPHSFAYVAGSGLYVNAGGGNPGTHRAQVGHRNYGFYVPGQSWITITGFSVRRCESRSIQLTNAANVTVSRNVLSFSGHFGMQADGCSALRIALNVVGDNADHGIAMIGGTTGCTIEGNESFRNARPAVRAANGLYLFGCPNNLIQRNRWHDNQDTGEQIQSGSDGNVSLENISWNNGDHGFDHEAASGSIHIGDVAYHNYKDGFSFEGTAPSSQVFDCIAVENGLTTGEYDLWVDGTSTSGFQSNDNIFWNSTAQPPVKYITTTYTSVADYSAASGQDTRTKQADPRFADPSHADFHLLAGSPAIDDANSGVAHWPATDAEGRPRQDDPATPNTGVGPVTYADRGALEFQGSANQPPVARLTVSPSSGQAPLSVTADASASSDSDGSITSYRFDFGDGTVVGPQSSPTATHTYAAGRWTCTVVVTDNAGATASASVGVTATSPSANLVGNPSFEQSTTGWAPVGGATLQRVSGGHDGSYSLLVQAPLLGLQPFGVTDEPNWVSSTPAAGTTYRFSAWVLPELGAGIIRLRVRESGPSGTGTWVESGGAALSLTSWQQLQLDYTTQFAGSTLDLQIVDEPSVVLEKFRVDEVSIVIASQAAAAVFESSSAAAGAVVVTPNPMRAHARLVFATSSPGPVGVLIFDLSGRLVRSFLDPGATAAGLHVLPLDAGGGDGVLLRGGEYFIEIRSPEGVRSGRFVITR